MSIKKHHWFPFYHDSWVVDTRHLSLEEQGIYLNLLLMQFDKGTVDRELAKKLWPSLSENNSETLYGILDQFFTHDTEATKASGSTYRRFWKNKRMTEVMQEQHKKSETRSHQTERARAAKKKRTNTVTKSVTDTVTEPVTKPVTKPVTEAVTGRELELEIELELEQELKQELKPKLKALTASQERLASDLPSIVFAVQRWNELAQHEERMATVAKITDRRKKKWEASRSKAGFLSAWLAALEKLPIANTATFKWQPNFDWMLSLDNVVKLSEGCYDAASETDERNERVSRFINE